MTMGRPLLVLAGGSGSRLRPVVSDVPKAMAPVGDFPFLHYQLRNWTAQGQRSFVFLLHHKAEAIVAYLTEQHRRLLSGCTVDCVIEPAPLDTGGAVAYAVRKLGLSGDILLTNADTWLGAGIQELSGASAPAIAVVLQTDSSRYGQVRFAGDMTVEAFIEKTANAGSGWINAGLSRLRAEVFSEWDGAPLSLERTTFVDLAAQHVLKAVPLSTDFIDIGVPEDYRRFCAWVQTGQEQGEL